MPNYVLLNSVTLNANTGTSAGVTFSNIPQDYTDLKIVVSARSNYSDYDALWIQFNGDTGFNYFNRNLRGQGSTPSSTTESPAAQLVAIMPFASQTANTFGNAEIYISNYSVSGIAKSVRVDCVTENNSATSTSVYNAMYAGQWNGTAAITSIVLRGNGTQLVTNSSFSLYGIAASGTTPAVPKAYGGNTVVSDGTYWYHAFTSSGSFTATQALSCDILTVAGGGGVGALGGGAGASGGGGAGGLVYLSSQSIIAGNNTVLVGAGGTNISDYYVPSPSKGSNSQFAALTAAVGGGYGGPPDLTGGSGGSGGGGGMRNSTGGAGTSGQGNAGGNGYNGGSSPAGGGGGAGGVGGNASSGTGGVGGVGVNTYSTWASLTQTGNAGYYAGGGGGQSWYGGSGGSGGAGGGGAGRNGSDGSGTNGLANTGGGAGGGNYGATGGSGVVIVRYAV